MGDGLDTSYGRRGDPVRLLDADPDLAKDLDPPALARAGDLIVGTRWLHERTFVGFGTTDPRRRGLGLLVVEGLVSRHVGEPDRLGAELLGPCNLLRPWDRDDEDVLGFTVSWRVWQPVRLAVLDRAFVERAAAVPEILEALVGRAVERVFIVATNFAIARRRRVDERLLLMLWHLAGRWGRVRKDGVLLAVPLTHALLAELVGARRPAVTTNLAALERRGLVARRPEGLVLLGGPPSHDR